MALFEEKTENVCALEDQKKECAEKLQFTLETFFHEAGQKGKLRGGYLIERYHRPMQSSLKAGVNVTLLLKTASL